MILTRLSHFRFSPFVRRGALYLLLMALFSLYLYLAGTNQGFTDESLLWLIRVTLFINFYLFWFAAASLVLSFQERYRRLRRLVWYLLISMGSALSFLALMTLRVWMQ